jgi:predicted lipoprotein
MPDLKMKLETLIAGAAECEMIGNLAADPAKRAEFRRRAQDMRELAERVRTQVADRPRSDLEFLTQQAQRCRSLADTIADESLKTNLEALADELEQTATRARGVS